MQLPETMTAVMGAGQGKMKVVTDVAVPKIPDGYILCKVSHVALNPTDNKHIHNFPHPGTTSGCDFSGTVAALGAHLPRPWTVGQRVAGICHGAKFGHVSSGAFAEYCLMKAHQGLAIPASMSDAEAACLGVSSVTCGFGLYQMLNLPWPDQVGRARTSDILIYGGSSATGLLAIQLAKLSGFRVVTTASKRNWEMLRGLGADEVFAYGDAEECIRDIRAATGGKLELAFDAIGEGEAPRICAEAMTQEKGRASYVTIAPFYKKARTEEELWQKYLFAYTSFGEEFEDLNTVIVAMPEDAAFAGRWWLEMERLCAEGKIRFFPIVRGNALAEDGLIQGLADLRAGKVSGGKLVYSIA